MVVGQSAVAGGANRRTLNNRGRDVELTLHLHPIHDGESLHSGLTDRQELHERQSGLFELVCVRFEDVAARGRLARLGPR